MLTDLAQWERLKQLGIMEWIQEKKATGAIRNIGFSFHGNTENFLKILDDYDWDFCQIQYNYLDETTQAGVRGLKAAAAKGIPVIIGEFGAENKDNPADRTAYYAYYLKAAAARGIPCFIWDNGPSDSYGLLDRANGTWYYPGIMDAIRGAVG